MAVVFLLSLRKNWGFISKDEKICHLFTKEPCKVMYSHKFKSTQTMEYMDANCESKYYA